MLSPPEVTLVIEAASSIPLTTSEYSDGDLGTALVSTVVDFQMPTVAVERALAYFEAHRGDELSSLDDFERVFADPP